jgi:O-antigen/teichoic acid export membrane protein
MRERLISSGNTIMLSECLGYSVKYYGSSLVGILILNLDKIIIWLKGSTEQFGFYVVAYSLSRLIAILPEILSIVIFAKFAGIKSSEVSVVTSAIFTLLFLPLLFVVLLIIMLSPWFIPAVFGEEFKLSIIPFMLLSLESIFSAFSWMLAQRFNADGRPGLVFIRQVISIIPIAIVIFYNGNLDLTLSISIALLVSSIIRIYVTFWMYDKVLNECTPDIIPKRGHFELLKKSLKR